MILTSDIYNQLFWHSSVVPDLPKIVILGYFSIEAKVVGSRAGAHMRGAKGVVAPPMLTLGEPKCRLAPPIIFQNNSFL